MERNIIYVKLEQKMEESTIREGEWHKSNYLLTSVAQEKGL